jgi:hypothetical protein
MKKYGTEKYLGRKYMTSELAALLLTTEHGGNGITAKRAGAATRGAMQQREQH